MGVSNCFKLAEHILQQKVTEIIGVARGVGCRTPPPPPIEMQPMIKMPQKKTIVSSVSASFSTFAYNSKRVQQ